MPSFAFFLTVFVNGTTVKPATLSWAVAAMAVFPTTFGIFTFGSALATVRSIVVPVVTWVPAVGFSEITVPGVAVLVTWSKTLERQGWQEIRSKGSHRHFKHPIQRYVITVPGHDGKELAPGTLNAIPKKAGLK